MERKVPVYFPFYPEKKREEEELSPPEGLLETLKSKLDEGIYKWDEATFPMELPPALPRHQGSPIRLSDLIREPNYQNELQELAYDESSRQLRKLDFLQMQEIRRTGEFAVLSNKFPGQYHVWRLTLLLQKGSNNIRETARKEYAFALTNLIIWIPNRLFGNSFSIPNGFKKIFRSILWDIPTLLWGWIERERQFPEYEVNRILEEKKNKYLLADLTFGKDYDPIESTLLSANQVTTEDGTVFDFRLYNNKIYRLVIDRLSSIQSSVRDEFYKQELRLQKQIFNELKASGSTESDTVLAQEVANRLELEQQRMLEDRIRKDSSIGHIAELIFDSLEAGRILQVARTQLRKQRDTCENQIRAELSTSYPIRSLIYPWVEKRVHEVTSKFDEEHKYFVLERAIQLATERRLTQAEYFWKRELYFRKEREGAYKVQLEAKKVPSRIYYFHRHIWNPKNWKIQKEDRVPPYYTCQNYSESTVSSDTLFWRIKSIFYRTGTYWNNSLYALYRRPLGFRSLLSPTAFQPDTILDTKTGVLITGNRKVQSFASRLSNLWKSIFDSRRDFEQKPDTGFLGKSVTRIFNVVCTVLALTSMVWCPLGAVLAQLGAILFYDYQAPRHSRWHYRLFPLLQILVRGVLNGVVQVGGSLLAIVANVLLYILVSFGCGFHFAIRSLYDLVIFYLVIKWRARRPATNTFAAKRIRGPGLSRESCFQINPDLALVALQVKMETTEIEVCEQSILEKIRQAKEDSLHHISKFLGPLGLQINSNNEVVVALTRSENNLIQKFHELKKERQEKFPFQIDRIPHRDRIVLEKADLESTLRRASVAVAHFYSTRILPRKSTKGQEKFWESNRLIEGDWNGLARGLLASLFSERFLSPLEEVDKKLVLKIEHASIHQYAEGLIDTGAIPDDLTVSQVEFPSYYLPDVPPNVITWSTGSLELENTLKNTLNHKFKKVHKLV